MHEDTPAAPATRWAAVARIERRAGWIAAGLGGLAVLSWRLLDGDEHRFAVLLLVGIPALLGGVLLVLAGRALQRPGPGALLGQLLLVGFLGYWIMMFVG